MVHVSVAKQNKQSQQSHGCTAVTFGRENFSYKHGGSAINHLVHKPPFGTFLHTVATAELSHTDKKWDSLTVTRDCEKTILLITFTIKLGT